MFLNFDAGIGKNLVDLINMQVRPRNKIMSMGGFVENNEMYLHKVNKI